MLLFSEFKITLWPTARQVGSPSPPRKVSVPFDNQLQKITLDKYGSIASKNAKWEQEPRTARSRVPFLPHDGKTPLATRPLGWRVIHLSPGLRSSPTKRETRDREEPWMGTLKKPHAHTRRQNVKKPRGAVTCQQSLLYVRHQINPCPDSCSTRAPYNQMVATARVHDASVPHMITTATVTDAARDY